MKQKMSYTLIFSVNLGMLMVFLTLALCYAGNMFEIQVGTYM